MQTVAYVGSFYGTYRDPRDHVGGVPTVRSYFKVFPEYKVPSAEWRTYEHTRTGALVGASLAKRYQALFRYGARCEQRHRGGVSRNDRPCASGGPHRGAGLMVLVGLVVGALPAARAMRLRVADALARR